MLRMMWVDQRGSEILQRPECLRLLALESRADGLGRLALSRAGAPIVQPVNFAYHHGDILIRLGEGLMADTVPGSVVAFEVDGVDREEGVAWSVLVRGLACRVEDTGALPADGSPRPMAPIPGSEVVALRPEVVTGRRFALHGSQPAESRSPGERAASK
jgi:hypothetical protein